jgi:hypothetical protein
MTDYGQGIAPRWYQDTATRQCTKTNFAWHLHRALLQVGMIPIRGWNPFDLELPAYEEYNPGSDRGDLVWYYDFPTAETFNIDGVLYRPVLCMVNHVRNSGGVTVGESASFFRFEFGYRRADRLIRDDFMNLVRCHTVTSNFGVGSFNSAMGVSTDLSYAASSGLGAYYQLGTWKVWSGSADANRTTLQPVSNIHVMLTPGGLVVQVGTGTSKTDSNDILSFSIPFGGARIPGRARIPASDPNLNRINPAFILPHRANALEGGTTPNYWVDSQAFEDFTYSSVRPCSYVLGVQHDLKVARATAVGYTTRPGAVRLDIYNLENIQRPIYPSPKAPTQNSPRAYNGGGAHILQPVVYTQTRLKTDGNDFYQVQNFDIRSQISPEWEDIWYCPNYRFADRTAPYGEYVDPVTGYSWFVFRAEGINSMMATNVEGATKFSSFNISSTFNLLDDDHFNLNGGFTWTVGNPQQASASQTAGVSMSQNWTATPATDEATAIHLATSGTSTWTFVAEPYSVAADVSYTLQLEIRWYSVSAQSNGTSNAMELEYSSDDGTTWLPLQTIYNTGVSAIPFNSYTATAEFPIWPGTLDGKIRFRLRTLFSSATGGNRTAAVRNIRIRQYERA